MMGSAGQRHSTIAPAKVNLTLSVGSRRLDGYHDVESVVVKVSLFDGIDILPAADPAIEIECPDSAVPTDERNSIWKACDLLSRQVDQPSAVRIQLHKRIPVAAGMGGGSSDAAAVLEFLNAYWQVNLDVGGLSALAEQIGSDVPLFLRPSSVCISGRGEIVEPVSLPWRGWMVLVMPEYPISTAQVYRMYRDTRQRPQADARACLDRNIRFAGQLDELLFNDLEASIFAVEPRLRELKSSVEGATDHKFHVTGSGSTLFACFDDFEAARDLRERVDDVTNGRTQVVRVLTTEASK